MKKHISALRCLTFACCLLVLAQCRKADPVADFSFETNTQGAGDALRIENRSLDATSSEWTFYGPGDKELGSSKEITPDWRIPLFAEDGLYTVALRVKDKKGKRSDELKKNFFVKTLRGELQILGPWNISFSARVDGEAAGNSNMGMVKLSLPAGARIVEVEGEVRRKATLNILAGSSQTWTVW